MRALHPKINWAEATTKMGICGSEGFVSVASVAPRCKKIKTVFWNMDLVYIITYTVNHYLLDLLGWKDHYKNCDSVSKSHWKSFYVAFCMMK